MKYYDFMVIENSEGPFEVPGEIIETYTTRPASHDQFQALVKLDEEEMDTTGSGSESENSVSSERVNLKDLPGVGDTTADNLHREGFKYVSDFDNPDGLEEVDGIGPASIDKILEYINNEY
jgi:endonuclease III-like uncharacterized protein